MGLKRVGQNMLINDDYNAYSEYILKRDFQRSRDNEINNLKSEISELTNLVKRLLNGNSTNNA